MALPATVVAAGMGPLSSGAGLVHGPQSPLIDTKRTCARVALSEATVLLTGETGTGKEVFARFIHGQSPRASRGFVPVNCGAIPDALLESELFGYVKGAFTGAASSRKGRVALSEGGTLFLDEIGELPLALQVKLLRLLQERTYEPIGSSESVSANFRLIAATNRDLAEEVRAGRFRSDLYYRLHVCPVRLPALRERRGDIAPLFQYFWNRRGETRPLEPAVMQCLMAYSWMGNVRELENLVERVSVCAEGDVIRLADIPVGLRAPDLEPADIRDAVNAAAALVHASPVSPFGQVDSRPATSLSASDSGWPAELLAPEPTSSLASISAEITGAAANAALASTNTDESNSGVGAEKAPTYASLSSLAEMATQARDAFQRAMVSAGDGVIGSPTLGNGSGNTPTPILQFPVDLPTMLRELENRYINAALAHTGSNKKEAAKLLGMGRTTLVEKLRRRATDRPASPDEEGGLALDATIESAAPRS